MSHEAIDTIKLPKDFDYDNISISHDSENSIDNAAAENAGLSNLLQTVIDEMIDKKQKIDDE